MLNVGRFEGSLESIAVRISGEAISSFRSFSIAAAMGLRGAVAL